MSCAWEDICLLQFQRILYSIIILFIRFSCISRRSPPYTLLRPFSLQFKLVPSSCKLRLPSKSESMPPLLIPDYCTRQLENDPFHRLEVQKFDPIRLQARCSECIVKELLKDSGGDSKAIMQAHRSP